MSSALTPRESPRRIVRTRDLYAMEHDSELIQSLDFHQQCVMIRSRLNLPCEVGDNGRLKPISRTTVKHVHARFEDICCRFEFMYDRADDREHWGVVNALIFILGELCPDSVLCDMFFERLQLFPRLTWLLRGPIRVRWFYPLELLCMVVRRGSDSTRLTVAKHPDTLNLIFQSHLSDHRAVEYNNMIIAHALQAAFTSDPPQPELVSSAQLLSLTHSVFVGVSTHQPRYTYLSVSHALVILSMSRFRHELDNPSHGIQWTLDFFAALTKIEDLSIRALGLRIFLPPRFTGNLAHSPDTPSRGRRSFPDHLRHLLDEHESGELESNLVTAAIGAFHGAVSALSHDQDLCKFGSVVAEILQRVPFVPGLLKDSGVFPSGDDAPYASLDDCLLATVKALRETGDPSEQDVADIVELGRVEISGTAEELAAAASAAMTRNPQLTYAYVVLCRSNFNREEALRTAESGLECAAGTPYLRRELLLSAMNDAFRKGWTLLLCGEFEDPDRRAWGKQYTTAGAKYMDEVLRDCTLPLDSPDLWLALNWAFVHAIFSAGADLEADIANFKSNLLPRLDACESVLKALGYDVKASPVHRGREAYLARLPTGIESYTEGVSRFDMLTKDFRVPYDQPTQNGREEDALYAFWWNVAEDELVPAMTHGPLQCGCRYSREMYAEAVVLGRCGWCRKPSAILKQCARCREVLYCDGKCQRQDWPRHKTRCQQRLNESGDV
ncbi:hypothetical protein L226DRAFT_573924 [Lentinus tigrinus ALCF2SS1-7]|uniref:MYND-type domain-containing protein n=1 Tax=Lentinus tigrinus ALCF2SS1-6 TaxID=1328759 RepID=A0A5C2RZL2_9APHY|nr:hypothetical protein L227DRAFT_614559 [Lentinus tigrinus ALCF2SS1-6]RPD71444.1 hypothetical protein L226DRAFT_573924 [Lentinus tigrinus ALCF2SS1-7]